MHPGFGQGSSRILVTRVESEFLNFISIHLTSRHLGQTEQALGNSRQFEEKHEWQGILFEARVQGS